MWSLVSSMIRLAFTRFTFVSVTSYAPLSAAFSAAFRFSILISLSSEISFPIVASSAFSIVSLADTALSSSEGLPVRSASYAGFPSATAFVPASISLSVSSGKSIFSNSLYAAKLSAVTGISAFTRAAAAAVLLSSETNPASSMTFFNCSMIASGRSAVSFP